MFGDLLGDLMVILNGLYMGLYSHNGDVIVHNLMGNLYGFCMDYMYGLYDGFYMESLWIVIEWAISMDYIWIIHGLFGDLMGT